MLDYALWFMIMFDTFDLGICFLCFWYTGLAFVLVAFSDLCWKAFCLLYMTGLALGGYRGKQYRMGGSLLSIYTLLPAVFLFLFLLSIVCWLLPLNN